MGSLSLARLNAPRGPRAPAFLLTVLHHPLSVGASTWQEAHGLSLSFPLVAKSPGGCPGSGAQWGKPRAHHRGSHMWLALLPWLLGQAAFSPGRETHTVGLAAYGAGTAQRATARGSLSPAPGWNQDGKSGRNPEKPGERAWPGRWSRTPPKSEAGGALP